MGRIHDYGDEAEYAVRIPVKMVQLTEIDGRAWPLAFDWKNGDGEACCVKIDRVLSCTPDAERKSGAVGDRYECLINGRTEYLYYARLQPRKWFLIRPVSKDEYNKYYKLPGESRKENKNVRAILY